MNPPESERLSSGKAVTAGLLLAGVILAALAVFLFVVIDRACASRRTFPAAADGGQRSGTASI